MILQSTDYIHPAAEAFKQGQMEIISQTDVPLHETAVWSDYPLNIALVVFSAFFFIMTLRSHYRIALHIIPALSRTNSCISFEKNYQLVHQRNLAAFSLILPFVLLIDRFNVLKFTTFEDKIPAEWHLCITLGLFLVYLLFRSMMYHAFRPRYKHEVWRAGKASSKNFFILMSELCLLSSGLLIVLGASDLAINKTIICESILVYLILLIRKCQILRTGYSAFLTFLYLCALEILPVLILVTARFVTLL